MDIIRSILEVINVFFIVYLIGYSTFLFLSVVVGSQTLYRKKREKRMKAVIEENIYIPISIIVPAYNEEQTVVETVHSLLALDYRLYEIIVVDDGSKDNTSKKLIEAFNMKAIRRPIRRVIPCENQEFVYEALGEKVPLTLVRKKNGGKADALNMGINISKYPYFICIDADSMLQYDSLTEIVKPILENSNIIAVGGAVRPANGVQLYRGRVIKYRLPNNLLACMQVLEYDRSFLASRILLDKYNGSLIISGAFGLFKKDVVINCGGYSTETLGEDMELVVKLHEFCLSNDIPYRIAYATNAICWSQVPGSLHGLVTQRRRWHRGLYQSMVTHRRMFNNPRYGFVSLVSYFYFLLYELLSPYIELLGLLSIVLALIIETLNVPFMIIFFLVYAVYGTVLSLSSFFSRVQTIDLKLKFTDALKAVVLCFFEVVILRFILAFVRMTAISFRRKKKVKYEWGTIKRSKNEYITK